MNPKNLTRMLAMLGLTAIGLSAAVPAAGLAGQTDEHEAFAQGMRGQRMRGTAPHAGGPHARIEQMMRRLELDEAQQETIRAILVAGRAAGEPLREQLGENLEALRLLQQDERAGDRALGTAVDAVIQARRALHEHHMSIKDQVREVLTPRQQAELVLMAERRGKPHRGRRGPSGPGPGPR